MQQNNHHIYVVSYYDNLDDKEPIITVWDNPISARSHIDYLVLMGYKPWLDKTYVYTQFIKEHNNETNTKRTAT